MGLRLPLDLNQSDRNILMSYLWKIEVNRNFILLRYEDVDQTIYQLINSIKKEIRKN